MKRKKILLLGTNGQLGFELSRTLLSVGELVSANRLICDLTDTANLRQLIQQTRPDVIVNAAAYTAVDKAEADRETAFAINGRAPGILGQEADAIGAFVIHYSTDYVFDGKKRDGYDETDPPQPINVYGDSKLAGEQALQASCAHHLILRTSWVFGAHGHNFLKTILRLAQERDHLKIVADQWGTPTPAFLLAELTAQLIRTYFKEGTGSFPFGLYHVAASGETNWCDYAREVILSAVKLGYTLNTKPERVEPIPSTAYPCAAQRPLYARLNCQRFESVFNYPLPSWEEGVTQVLKACHPIFYHQMRHP